MIEAKTHWNAAAHGIRQTLRGKPEGRSPRATRVVRVSSLAVYLLIELWIV